jgi:hypothetical protein
VSKADPTLKRTSVAFSYTSSDGYRSEMKAKGGKGSKNLRTGEEEAPELVLLAMLQELTRILCLFGFEAQALEAFAKQRIAVQDWRESRAK